MPSFTLQRIQAKASDAAYLPTRLPFGYAYERWRFDDGKLVVTFKHRRSSDRFTFQVRRLPQGMECDLQGSFHRTLQMDGNKVFYGGEQGEWIAWRCVTSPKTQTRYLLRSTRAGRCRTWRWLESPRPASASPVSSPPSPPREAAVTEVATLRRRECEA